MRSDERCEHGCVGGSCPDEKCPGYWLDVADPKAQVLLDDLHLEAWLGSNDNPPRAAGGGDT